MINCMNLEKIKNLLINISQFEIIKIIDNSSSHASHKGVQGLLNNLTHVEIHVKNPNNLNINSSIDSVSCIGSNDGVIDITIIPNTNNFTYSWVGPNGFTSSEEDIDDSNESFDIEGSKEEE